MHYFLGALRVNGNRVKASKWKAASDGEGVIYFTDQIFALYYFLRTNNL